jgi:hypothetical protein
MNTPDAEFAAPQPGMSPVQEAGLAGFLYGFNFAVRDISPQAPQRPT